MSIFKPLAKVKSTMVPHIVYRAAFETDDADMERGYLTLRVGEGALACNKNHDVFLVQMALGSGLTSCWEVIREVEDHEMVPGSLDPRGQFLEYDLPEGLYPPQSSARLVQQPIFRHMENSLLVPFK